MEHDRLLGVHEHGRVVLADGGPSPGALADDGGEGGQHPLGDAVGVLRGQVELEAGRVEGARPDAQGVEQGVLAVPGPLHRVRRRSHRVRIQWHVRHLAFVRI